jgi:cation transport regulator ChaB
MIQFPIYRRVVKNVLPKHAQEIYLAVYTSAWEQYDKPAKDVRQFTGRTTPGSLVRSEREI